MRRFSQLGWAGALVCAGAVLLYARSGAGQYDPNLRCVLNLEKLTLGVLMYAQDYDEKLPRMTNPITFHDLVMPYIRDTKVFICPATFLLYTDNSRLSEKQLSSFPDTSVIKVAWDTRPHRDHLLTVGFLDGHVERGGIPIYVDPQGQLDPNAECVQYVRALDLGTMMYAQDYDERLPPMNTQAQYQASIFPYVRVTRKFTCPATLLKYAPNSSLSGTSFMDYPLPAAIPVLWDPKPHSDGKTTYGYLDGHVRRE